MDAVKLIECPRDAWQGIPVLIPTETKAAYLKELILAGFKHIDAVSFVSPKHVTQMADSEDVMSRLMDSLPDGIELPEIIGIVVESEGSRTSPGHTRRFDNRLSLLHFRLFSTLQREHESCPNLERSSKP